MVHDARLSVLSRAAHATQARTDARLRALGYLA
jgi:hypothetical protein